MVQNDLAARTATEFLSVGEQRRLIADVQDVPVTVALITDDEGTEVEHATYGSTPASEQAMTELVTAFNPLLNKIARTTKVQETEDAYSVVLLEFVEALRRYDLDSDVPFSALIPTILRYRLSDADRTSDLIVVKENVAARYHRLVHKHDGDIEAAYAECRDTTNGFDPVTFLAVHRVIGSGEGVRSIDFSLDLQDGKPQQVISGKYRAGGQHRAEDYLMPIDGTSALTEDFITRDLADWLLTQITPRQALVQRLWHGFADEETEKVALAANLRPGDVLTEQQIAFAAGVGRGTVTKEKRVGLETMRAAYKAALDD